MAGDATLVCTTYDVASRVSAAKNRTYVYNFARVIPLPFVELLDLGAFHGAEIGYVLGSIPPPTAYTDGTLAAWMQEYWSRFAASGKPKATKAPGWPRFKHKSYRMLRLDASVEKMKDFRRAQCEFWSQYYELNN